MKKVVYCWVYSVKLKDNRIIVQCNILNRGKLKFIRSVYDTGAKYSCFRASYIASNMTEKELLGHEEKLLCGFVGVVASKFYRLHVESLAFGNIDLGEQDIWITFDENVTMNVIGYDIISQISRVSIANSCEELFFSSTTELKRYIDEVTANGIFRQS